MQVLLKACDSATTGALAEVKAEVTQWGAVVVWTSKQANMDCLASIDVQRCK